MSVARRDPCWRWGRPEVVGCPIGKFGGIATDILHGLPMLCSVSRSDLLHATFGLAIEGGAEHEEPGNGLIAAWGS